MNSSTFHRKSPSMHACKGDTALRRGSAEDVWKKMYLCKYEPDTYPVPTRRFLTPESVISLSKPNPVSSGSAAPGESPGPVDECPGSPIGFGRLNGRDPMLPKPSLCLNIPKTGSSWMRHFFDAADWLELRRRCGLGHRTPPLRASLELVRMAKRYGPEWGSLNCRARDHHAGYGSLPAREHPTPSQALLPQGHPVLVLLRLPVLCVFRSKVITESGRK